MTVTTTAVYENGVLHLAHRLDLKEGEAVQVTVSTPVPRPSDEELIGLLKAATTPDELFAIANAYPTAPPDYDLCDALNGNRGPGERVLYPPELKGKTW